MTAVTGKSWLDKHHLGRMEMAWKQVWVRLLIVESLVREKWNGTSSQEE